MMIASAARFFMGIDFYGKDDLDFLPRPACLSHVLPHKKYYIIITGIDMLPLNKNTWPQKKKLRNEENFITTFYTCVQLGHLEYFEILEWR